MTKQQMIALFIAMIITSASFRPPRWLAVFGT